MSALFLNVKQSFLPVAALANSPGAISADGPFRREQERFDFGNE
jgi:hypothetical protein